MKIEKELWNIYFVANRWQQLQVEEIHRWKFVFLAAIERHLLNKPENQHF
jgi:hypothetical protein